MINKKLLALLVFTSHGMEANQDISSIDSQLQKQNSYKTLYVVLGSAAAVAIAGGAIWWFTKKDKKTTEGQQGQQPVEEREFNEQDIDDVLKLNTREEWLKLYEQKAKSHMKSAEKIAQEIKAKVKAIPIDVDTEEKKVKYREIFKNNKFAKDIIAVNTLFSNTFFEHVLTKEFLNKYKQQLSNNKELMKLFDLLLEMFPFNIKCNILAYSRKKIINLSPEVEGKLQDQYYKGLANYGRQCRDLINIDQTLNLYGKIELTSDEDVAAWTLILHNNETLSNLKNVFNINNNATNNTRKIMEKVISNNGIIKEFQKDAAEIQLASVAYGRHIL